MTGAWKYPPRRRPRAGRIRAVIAGTLGYVVIFGALLALLVAI